MIIYFLNSNVRIVESAHNNNLANEVVINSLLVRNQQTDCCSNITHLLRHAYRSAIQRYYAVAKRYPRSLDDLLKDSRFAQRSYLRTRYTDPMSTGKNEDKEAGSWRLVRAADGGIAGVSSRNGKEPLKKANFPPGLERFEGAKSYAEWLFVYELGSNNAVKPANLTSSAK